MAFVGLIPSEHSSGTKKARGAITKTGNAHLRRVLVEAAWHYRHHPFVGRALRRRQDEAPAAASHTLGPRNSACTGGTNGSPPVANRNNTSSRRWHGNSPVSSGQP